MGLLTDLLGGDAAAPGASAAALLHVQDQKASGTDGGAFTSGAWRTRTLNTVVENEITGASLASNEITLPAGTYEIDARVPAGRCHSHQARLYDVTGAAVLLYGSSSFSNSAANYSDTDSNIRGRFTLAAPSNIRIEHQCTVTVATNGFGWANGFGNTQVYTDVMIRTAS